MTDKATITYWDGNGKPTGITVNVPDLTGVNFATVVNDMDALRVALDAISLSGESNQVVSSMVKNGGPADRGGMRGTKALIRWYAAGEGSDGQYGSNELGAVDPDLFTPVGSKSILQGALYDAIKTAFDLLARTENGNTVSVYEIERVSRTL